MILQLKLVMDLSVHYLIVLNICFNGSAILDIN